MDPKLVYAGQFTLVEDEESGKRFWRGQAGADDMDESVFAADEPLTLSPSSWPLGTVITAQTPFDGE